MRPVGKYVRICLEASEQIGTWATAVELYQSSGVPNPATCINVMRRAVIYGLAEIDESSHPMRFRALKGWRQKLQKPEKPTPEKPKIINSVWNLA